MSGVQPPPVLTAEGLKHVRFERIDLDHFAPHFVGCNHLLPLLLRDHTRSEGLLEHDVARPPIEAAGADSVANLGLDGQRGDGMIERIL